MGIPTLKSEKYSYADYLTWGDDERRELINGAVNDMTAAPYTKHQRILLNLSTIIHFYLKGKEGQVFVAPFDVRLPDNSEDDDSNIYTVVQPDITVFQDKSKIDKRGAKGAPDWIVEILSNSTYKIDTTTKLELYEKHGVYMYWIIDPDREIISVYELDDQGRYHKTEYPGKGKIQVNIFHNLLINTNEIFAE